MFKPRIHSRTTRCLLAAAVLGTLAAASDSLFAQSHATGRRLIDPFADPRYHVLRVSPSDSSLTPAQRNHALMPVLRYAYERYEAMGRNIRDYRGKIVRRERIRGRLGAQEYMSFKVRHARVTDTNDVVPFGVYLEYLGPKRLKGREVLFVDGENDGNLVATRGGEGALRDITLRLPPDGPRAMRRNHYPVTEFGVQRLAQRLIEVGIEEMALEAAKDAKVRFVSGAKIDKRPCTMIEVVHPRRVDGLRFHMARIFVDEAWQVPVRYAAYTWPREGEKTPRLMEEYTYFDLEMNVGLSERDFDAENPDYMFREPRPDDEGSRLDDDDLPGDESSGDE
ncbi:MAG: DUF1571 domain-containing protein [Planctomycetota bacterium]|nr:MAG: DUF1571 domain-containing protein [Planctomycetota bacterium]REJ97858.1 MAG: DUF1571 domain-containing protein [Planctomycetota bacterium]